MKIEERIAALRAMEKQIAEIRQELTKDLEDIGLTWLTGEAALQDHEPKPEHETLNITDWRDLSYNFV